MTIDFIDASGRPRPEAEIEQALQWVKGKIVKVDFSDPAGVIHCMTIKDALTELLSIRKFLREKGETNS
jgi:hypothetical protein